ncbi:MAG: class I SAM-dependent methyltransferase [Acidimicrobiia bacterium]
MLTVDFDRFGVRAGMRLLDMGCGAGRHAFEALRRGAFVTAFDLDEAELKSVRSMVGVMVDARELSPDQEWGSVSGNALSLPFADAAFARVIASEVLEHVWDADGALRELARVTQPGGRIAVTVPTRWPERVCWALDRDYHDRPGGHVRIFRQPDLEARIEAAGFLLRGSHHAHALHAPYWWIRCAGGVNRDDAWLARKYHDFLVWELTNRPRWTRVMERTLNPVLGKSLVVYAERVHA